MARLDGAALMRRLPRPRGRLKPMRVLSELTWLRVGGPAEVLFTPADTDDLAEFLAQTPEDVPVTPIGVGSNVIIRDGGVPGVVVRLGPRFAGIETSGARVIVGAAALDARVAGVAAEAGIAGLEFLRGVPGAVGGALRMNAGAYGRYMSDVMLSAEAVARDGERRALTPGEMGFSYRDTGPRGLIYLSAVLEGAPDDPSAVRARMEALMAKRAAAQPVKDRTAGSTFRNPSGASSTGDEEESMALKAWRLIEDAGCRGLRVGGAVMSEKHANFLTNAGDATAADLEALGELVRRRVFEQSGHWLEWEIQRVGLTRPEAESASEQGASE